jgi:ATP-dependent Clp protease ATP-binding subunit ClpA
MTMPNMSFTMSFQEMHTGAKKAAAERRNGFVGSEHILLVLVTTPIRNTAQSLLFRLGVGPAEIKARIDRLIRFRAPMTASGAPLPEVSSGFGEAAYTASAQAAHVHAMTVARNNGHSAVGTGHVLLGLLDSDNHARRILGDLRVDYDSALAVLNDLSREDPEAFQKDVWPG